jgi:hypothetical protein
METMMEEIKANQPALIIDASPDQRSFYGWHPISRYPALHQYVEENYEIDPRYNHAHPHTAAHVYIRKTPSLADQTAVGDEISSDGP